MDNTATAAALPTATLKAHVIFGSTPKLAWFNSGDGGVTKSGPDVGCSVRGLCNVQSLAQGSFSSQLNGKSIEVTFAVVPSGYPSPGFQSYLSISFNLADLQQNQPAQAQYFSGVSGAYQFDAEFDLGSDVFAGLNLPAGAAIMTAGNSVYTVSEGTVTIMYGLYTKVSAYAIFGGEQDGVCQQYQGGFCSISADATPVNGITPTNVDFILVYDSYIMVCFNYAELKANQPVTAGTNVFSDPVANGGTGISNYPILNDISFDDPLFAPLGLAPGAMISASNSGTGSQILYNTNNNQFTIGFPVSYGKQQPPKQP